MFRVKTLKTKSLNMVKFYQDANSLEEAKVLAKWNFQKGYEIVDVQSGALVERWEHFCPTCTQCECGHLRSEHLTKDNGDPDRCPEKQCRGKCKEFKQVYP